MEDTKVHNACSWQGRGVVVIGIVVSRDGSAERRWGTELQLGSGKSLDDDHGSSALGTEPKEVCRLKLGSLWLVRRGECAEKLQTEWQQSGASAIGEDAKMANSDEAFGKQVQKEATQELIQG